MMRISILRATLETKARAIDAVRRLFQPLVSLLPGTLVFGAAVAIVMTPSLASIDDTKTVIALDAQYQSAVKRNDAPAMDHLLADNFVLVTGSGKTYTKADLLKEAQDGQVIYEQQDDSAQTVRIWGDTAILTAKLSAKGTERGKPFKYSLWFSDTYVRTATGWRYVFGQASLPLPSPI